MSTLSVPLTDRQRYNIKRMVQKGVASNESAFARQAIDRYLEELAIQAVLQAQQEPSLRGNIDQLAKAL